MGVDVTEVAYWEDKDAEEEEEEMGNSRDEDMTDEEEAKSGARAS